MNEDNPSIESCYRCGAKAEDHTIVLGVYSCDDCAPYLRIDCLQKENDQLKQQVYKLQGEIRHLQANIDSIAAMQEAVDRIRKAKGKAKARATA